MKEQIELMIDTTENESLVHRARNVSVGRFMQKTDCEYLMFIDADITLIPKAVVRLVKSGHELRGVLSQEGCQWDQAAQAIKKGDDRDMAMLSSLVVNIGAADHRRWLCRNSRWSNRIHVDQSFRLQEVGREVPGVVV